MSLLLLLSNEATLTPPIDPTWLVCEIGFVTFQVCISGEVTIQEAENGMAVFTTEVNGWI